MIGLAEKDLGKAESDVGVNLFQLAWDKLLTVFPF